MTASTEVKALCERLDALAKFTLSEDRANDFRKAKGLIESLSARNAEMVEALKPFAAKAEYADALEYDDADYVDCAPFSAGDFRRARAALDTPSEQLGER